MPHCFVLGCPNNTRAREGLSYHSLPKDTQLRSQWLNLIGRDPTSSIIYERVVTDLVQGEFMQLGSKETQNERFAHYLTKTYRKTASLIANSVKSVVTDLVQGEVMQLGSKETQNERFAHYLTKTYRKTASLIANSVKSVVTDLVQGELMQLGSKETQNERFAHYLTKTYRKTASLIANSVKSVTVLAGADKQVSELSYQYGRNLGLAFQLVDDLLDFVPSSAAMGKPTAADLKLGLATAPVSFACEKYPELNPMIMRRFQEPGDVEKVFELVHKSRGLEQTQFLAKQHCSEAVRIANMLKDSPYQKELVVAAD